jgi:hypothetical protein
MAGPDDGRGGAKPEDPPDQPTRTVPLAPDGYGDSDHDDADATGVEPDLPPPWPGR